MLLTLHALKFSSEIPPGLGAADVLAWKGFWMKIKKSEVCLAGLEVQCSAIFLLIFFPRVDWSSYVKIARSVLYM